MNEDEVAKNHPEAEVLSDNITGNETNEQFVKENPDWEPQESDNVSAELEDLKDSHLRLMAEYDNYRKRTMKEKAELIKNGGERVLVNLLPVVDDIERALNNMGKVTDIQSITEGIQLIYNKFISFLNQNGVKAIEAKGQIFDEELFDAVATFSVAEEDMKGKVIDCMQTGYTLNEKVIRHAKVVVAE